MASRILLSKKPLMLHPCRFTAMGSLKAKVSADRSYKPELGCKKDRRLAALYTNPFTSNSQ
jgi:hypothetical protein